MNDLIVNKNELSTGVDLTPEELMIQSLNDAGLSNDVLAKETVNILKNATRMNNQGDIHEDFAVKADMLKHLMKIKTKQKSGINVNILTQNHFTPPDNINH